MAYDLEEQEQLDSLRAWWKANGKYVQAAIVAVAIGFAGYKGWTYYQHQQSVKASARYEAMSKLELTDVKAIQSAAGELMEHYASTPYAARAAIAAAKASYEAKDIKGAKAQLSWAVEHAKEEQVAAVAQLQLAALLAEERDYDGALAALKEKHDPAFDGLYADLKGDIFAAKGDKAEAKAAYQEALTKLDEHGRYRHYTEYKLEALGS